MNYFFFFFLTDLNVTWIIYYLLINTLFSIQLYIIIYYYSLLYNHNHNQKQLIIIWYKYEELFNKFIKFFISMKRYTNNKK